MLANGPLGLPRLLPAEGAGASAEAKGGTAKPMALRVAAFSRPAEQSINMFNGKMLLHFNRAVNAFRPYRRGRGPLVTRRCAWQISRAGPSPFRCSAGW